MLLASCCVLFSEVRSAAIDSICELSTHSPNFAKLSQDFIIDMFNDEIESIRLNAIESVRKISQHLLLREDQLDIILAALKVLIDTTKFNIEMATNIHCNKTQHFKDCTLVYENNSVKAKK